MKETTLTDYRTRILKVLMELEKNPETSAVELASLASFSLFHFHRIFKGMVGESLADYCRRIKLDYSAAVLKSSNKSVTDLAFDCGYENVETYIRAFKKSFGITPLQFRKTHSLIHKIPGRVESDHRSRLDKLICQLKEVKMDVKIEKINVRSVIAARHVGPYKDCGQAWEKVCGFAGPKGLLGPTTKYLGLCYDDPEITTSDKIRYDACIEVESEIETSSELSNIEIPAGNYALILHKGPYENLHKTYAAVCGQWLVANNREIRNEPSIEVYLNSPESTAPEDLRTEIQIPIE